MGTNYYHRRDVCPTCGKPDEIVHIGKASAGWTFSFHGTEEIRSWQEWREVLRSGGEIRDEYGDVVSLERMEALVADRQHNDLNHTTYCQREHPDHARADCWLDPEGHSFQRNEFS